MRRGKAGRIIPCSAGLMGLIVIHDLDHVRQGRALSLEVYGAGAVAFVVGMIMLGMAVSHHHRSGFAATIVGFGTAVGITLVHVVPRWWAFSDPYPEAHADALSWIVLVAMIGVGLLLGLAGLRATLWQRGSESGA